MELKHLMFYDNQSLILLLIVDINYIALSFKRRLAAKNTIRLLPTLIEIVTITNLKAKAVDE
jgi:hypothetical protein